MRTRLLGWLSYAFARFIDFVWSRLSANVGIGSEVFVVVSLTLFLPICLEQFARDNGFIEPERIIPCIAAANEGTASSVGRCSVKIGWLWIDTASFRYVIHDTVCNLLTHPQPLCVLDIRSTPSTHCHLYGQYCRPP